jgi:GH35 family endo-1,4-beta-xylanase
MESCTYRRWKVQALRGHSLTWGLESHDWYTKRDPEKRCERAAKGMPDQPYVCVGKQQRDVIIEVLKPREQASTLRSSEGR